MTGITLGSSMIAMLQQKLDRQRHPWQASQVTQKMRCLLKKKKTLAFDYQSLNSISVRVALVRTTHFHSNVIRLLLAQLCEVSTQSWKVEPCNLFIQIFWQQINVILVFARSVGFLPISQQVQLRQGLVC